MNPSGVRSLALLEAGASTARVLNLRHVALSRRDDPDVAQRPFFDNPALNRGLVVKHHLRRHEADLFAQPRASATKVLLPIDQHNLRAGAKFFFVGQRDYAALMQQELGLSGVDNRDLQLLSFLDEIPAFDPFLMREQLRRRGLSVAGAYLKLSDADCHRMTGFVRGEIQPLVDIAFAAVGGASGEVLARKLLLGDDDGALQPLRHVLHLDAGQFAEGVFCWRAFLYYKWRLMELIPRVNTVAGEVSSIRPARRGGDETQDYILTARGAIHGAVTTACRNVHRALRRYDQAYGGLIGQGDGVGFRDFLLEAPGRFVQLGEELAAVDHLISFWNHRFPGHERRSIGADELAGIFRDFEASLHIQPRASPRQDAEPACDAA